MAERRKDDQQRMDDVANRYQPILSEHDIKTAGGEKLNADYYLVPELKNSDDTAVASLRGTYTGIREGFAALKGAISDDDPSETPTRNYVANAAAAEKFVTSANDSYKRSYTFANNTITAINNTINEQLMLNAEPPRAREIREHLKGLAEGDRTSAIHAAIENKEYGILAAVLTAEPMLSGVKPELHKTFRKLHEQKNAADLVTRRDAIRKGMDYNFDAIMELINTVDRWFPRERVNEFKQRSSKVQEARDTVSGWDRYVSSIPQR